MGLKELQGQLRCEQCRYVDITAWIKSEPCCKAVVTFGLVMIHTKLDADGKLVKVCSQRELKS